MASKRSSEKKSCASLTSNEKLEKMKLSEEGMLKAKIGQNTRPLALVSQLANPKGKFL